MTTTKSSGIVVSAIGTLLLLGALAFLGASALVGLQDRIFLNLAIGQLLIGLGMIAFGIFLHHKRKLNDQK